MDLGSDQINLKVDSFFIAVFGSVVIIKLMAKSEASFKDLNPYKMHRNGQFPRSKSNNMVEEFLSFSRAAFNAYRFKQEILLVSYFKQDFPMSKKQVTVTIEICSNCKQHKWCTRHNEVTYSALAQSIQKEIRANDSSIEVRIKPVGGNKMGSFEIDCNGTLLFSKLSLGYFPHISAASTRIMNFIEDYRNGGDLTKYEPGLSSPVRSHSAYNRSNSSTFKGSPSRGPVQLNHKHQNLGDASSPVKNSNHQIRKQKEPSQKVIVDDQKDVASRKDVIVVADSFEKQQEFVSAKSQQKVESVTKKEEKPEPQQKAEEPQYQKVQAKEEKPEQKAEQKADESPVQQQETKAEENKQIQSKEDNYDAEDFENQSKIKSQVIPPKDENKEQSKEEQKPAE